MNIKTMDQHERIDQQEWLTLQVSLHIEKLMEQQKVSRSQLAKRLGTDKSYVTKILDGANLTLRSIADIMTALDSSIVIDTKFLGFHTSIQPIDFTEIQSSMCSGYPRIKGMPIIQYTKNWTDPNLKTFPEEQPRDQRIGA